MNVLFEEDGSYKAANVLSDAGASLQVELSTGRRVRIKASAVMIRFESPTAAELLHDAQALAQSVDLDFLWECAPAEEFAYDDLAREWFGRAPAPVELAALLLRLHGAPVYFHRKGRGRYRSASPEQLKAALAGLERKRQQQECVDSWAAQLMAGRLPEPIGAAADVLAFAPDKMALEWKALERACQALQRSPERLLLALGAFASPRALHARRFYREQFPGGIGFPAWQSESAASASAQRPGRDSPANGLGDATKFSRGSAVGNALAQALRAAIPETLVEARVEAFSIDDSTTTEIDDALSVTVMPDGCLRVGVHIAAPGRDIAPDSALDRIGRARMSTVYMPGDKITMLPDAAIERWSLAAGRSVPALSLYVDLDESGTRIVDSFSRIDEVSIVENLRHDRLEGLVTEAALEEAPDAPAPGGMPRPFALRALWRLTKALGTERDAARGKPEPRNRVDFSFYIDTCDDGAEQVRIVQRRRDAPLDRIVAEMMILANARWGRLLADHRVPGIYRIQPPGTRVRMAAHAAPHIGLGVAQYAWCTSPLRRYVDLVNQRQLIAVLSGRTPHYVGADSDLFAVMASFDSKYDAYAEFQSKMERWWCLRWLQQEGLSRVDAVVTREDTVRLVHAPLMLRPTGLPLLPAGRRVRIDLLEQDELDLTVHARFVEVADEIVGEPLGDEINDFADDGGADTDSDARGDAGSEAGGDAGLEAGVDAEAGVGADADGGDGGDGAGATVALARPDALANALVGVVAARNRPDRYAVIGNPVEQSLSPGIHAQFAQAAGHLLQYERVLAPLDGFVAAVNAFRTSGGRGLNVTAPFKQQAFEYATERTARAEAAGAVNTLAFADHAVLGDNTDGVGLLRDIERLGVTLAGARVLVLGAGGAARGALAALLDAGCVEVAVANRTAARAFELSNEPALQGVLVLPIDALVEECFDIIINATSGGLQGASMPLPDPLLARARLAYDMIYGARPTAFLLQAQAAGCPLTANGLGMLVEQAAESFRLWRGVVPDTAPVLNALLQTLTVSAGGSGN